MHRVKLIEYMGDPDNEFPTRSKMPEICGIKKQTMYHHFTPDELCVVEAEGLELRRSRYLRQASEIDAGLMARAKEGDPAAAKLFYQRLEKWSEKTQLEHLGKIEEIQIRLVKADDPGCSDT
jgi:hypothetical protein